MSRPIKQGLDYFPMDVDCDDKIELIEAKHGISGFGIVIKLFQKIYKEGYFLNWNEETLLLFSKRINVNINEVTAVINDCLCYHVFDDTMYNKYKILTSSGIQKRYLNAIDRRKEIILDKRFIIVNINGINVIINWINEDISTQSKVKESKEYIYSAFYDLQLEISTDPNYESFVKFLFGENDLGRPMNKLLKLDDQIGVKQFEKLKITSEETGRKILDTCRDLENYTKKSYSSFYLTLNKWLKNVR